MVASELQKMVSKALQTRVREDFTGKLFELAAGLQIGDTYEEMSYVAKQVCDGEQMAREERAKAIFEANIAAARKSKF